MDTVAVQRRDHVDATAIAVLVVLCTLWGVQQVAVKVAVVQGLGPLLQAGLRSAVAAVLVLGWIAVKEGPEAFRAVFRRDAALGPGIVIAVLFGFEFLTLYPGLKLTTASRGVLFLYTAPFFTALGAHLFLPHERLTLRQALGLLIAFGGVAAAFADGLAFGGGSVAGDLLCLAAGALWGATTVVVKASPSLSRTPSSRILLIQLVGSAPILLGASALAGEMDHWPHATALAWAALFYQTVIVAFLSYLVWFAMIIRYPAGRLAGFTFLTPLFGILAGALLLGEHASIALLAGLVAIAVGLRLVNSRGPVRQGRGGVEWPFRRRDPP
ncbi:DMT family transporter [Limobrevibacterium gyesilva]|uniref:DMT family transporter n=1 Tax=Limobrevibacterium gyesilva TaxID=2991712 RepID=A0AA41YJB2_9PROT|nr:DMT family transporter [Limobrevibacterium gyesilva]MCW3473077.1 DMT family transporter [Limobrevibacterium gyesilva]